MPPPRAAATLEGEIALFSLTKRASGPSGLAGLCLGPDGMALVQVVPTPGGRPRLAVCDFEAIAPEEAPAALAAVARRHGLARARVVGVLPRDRYRAHMLEAPDVEANEMAAATRWLVRDLIDFPLEEAVTDYFEIPEPERGGRGNSRRLAVVSARQSFVRELVDATAAAGMQLVSVDIAELALRNVASRLRGSADGVALVQLGARRGLLTLCQRGCLYLARPLDTGLERLAAEAAERSRSEPGELELAGPEDGLDELLLEIQRSLDYYESQLRQPPLAQVVIAPLERSVPTLLPHLEKNLSVQVTQLDLSAVLATQQTLDETLQAHCLTAVGAALGGEAGAS